METMFIDMGRFDWCSKLSAIVFILVFIVAIGFAVGYTAQEYRRRKNRGSAFSTGEEDVFDSIAGSRTEKDVVLDFIADLVFPIDPLVFAGYGSSYQDEYSKEISSDDPGSALIVEEKYIADFIDERNPTELLDIMIEIFFVPPTDYSNNLATRRKDDWDYYVRIIIAKIGDRIPTETLERLAEIFENYSSMREEVLLVLDNMNFLDTVGLIDKMEREYGDLSDKEIDLIKEIKERNR